MGFLTKEFTVDRGSGPEALMAVYVPTNHLYLGDIVVYPRDRVFFPDLTVEEGIRIFLTGGMSLPGQLRQEAGDPASESPEKRSDERDVSVDRRGAGCGAAWRC